MGILDLLIVAEAGKLQVKANQWHDKATAKIKHRRLDDHLKKGDIKTEAMDAAYHMQGDVELSTKEAYDQRQKLRRNPSLLKELDRWWSAALSLEGKKHSKCIGQQRYLHIYRLLSYELLGEEHYDGEESTTEALEEWEKDGIQGTEISRTKFLDAIFEICDVYTANIDPAGALAAERPSHYGHRRDPRPLTGPRLTLDEVPTRALTLMPP